MVVDHGAVLFRKPHPSGGNGKNASQPPGTVHLAKIDGKRQKKIRVRERRCRRRQENQGILQIGDDAEISGNRRDRPPILRKRRRQRIGECIDPFRQIERKIIEPISVDGTGAPHPLRRRLNTQIIEHPPERLTLRESPDIMNPDGAVDSVPFVAAHQTARQRIFFNDRHISEQPGKDDPDRKSPDPGTDDQRIKRLLCFHGGSPGWRHRMQKNRTV